MKMYLERGEEKTLKAIVERSALSFYRGRNTRSSFSSLEQYIYDIFFDPKKREKSIHNEGKNLLQKQELLDLHIEYGVVENLAEKGFLIIAGDNIVPTPLGIRAIEGEQDLQTEYVNLTRLYQRRLSEKTVDVFSQKEELLNAKEMSAVIFLLYNNNTSRERGKIGDEKKEGDLAKAIDRITDSFVIGDASRGTRSLNGRLGGGYFVHANRKLDFPIITRKPYYYIQSSEIQRVRGIVKKSIAHLAKTDTSFKPMESFDAFEMAYNNNIDFLLSIDAVFATIESKSDVESMFVRQC